MLPLSDRPGLRNPELVGKMQEKLKMVLKNILVPQHPEHSSIFRELLTIIHDLRTLNTLHTEKFLQQSRVFCRLTAVRLLATKAVRLAAAPAPAPYTQLELADAAAI